ncbi:hypothetical protein VPNG_02714 [Cytospora leucostoma]|uniref:N-acetyltransferase domain-containing protein n=1 Tax=Cytospora leucostoma TaxID=1230097 RepID=A0A423XJB3_9PEZI|nr:hypothetical protein VPNG_02714 [Cytospora leucostoma]
MSRAQQPSILSFFQPNDNTKQQPPIPSAPPSQTQIHTKPQRQEPQVSTPPPPPQAPPIPQQPPAAKPTNLAPIPVTALPPTIPTPHPSATIVPVTDAYIPALRRINALLLPVNYTDAFYKAILDPAQSGLFSRAILFQDDPASPAKVVGGLICRLEPSPFDPQDSDGRYSPGLAKKAAGSVAPPPVGLGHALYVQSLVLLAPYRGLGLAAAAIEGIFDAVRTVTRERRGNGLNIKWVYAHVWTENEEGLAWYARRGFERDVRLEGYYFKLKPGSAWVVKRRVVVDGEDERPGKDTVSRQGATPVGNGHVAHAQPDAIPLSVTAAAVNLPGFTPTINAPPSAGPPKSTSRPPLPENSLSFQNKRPDMEWNDLPEDMVAATPTRNSSRSNLVPPPTSSGATSRSSSATGRKKRDRAYPTAAFGS